MEIKPLDKHLACEFMPNDRQEDDWVLVLEALLSRDIWPPHIACFVKDGEPVFVVGAVEASENSYRSFNFFGKNFKRSYLPMVVRYVKDYLERLGAERVTHSVEKCDIQMKRVCEMMGFVPETEDEEYVLYVRS